MKPSELHTGYVVPTVKRDLCTKIYGEQVKIWKELAMPYLKIITVVHSDKLIKTFNNVYG
jgi:hypothetical protein